jgi:hypothetical protein
MPADGRWDLTWRFKIKKQLKKCRKILFFLALFRETP